MALRSRSHAFLSSGRLPCRQFAQVPALAAAAFAAVALAAAGGCARETPATDSMPAPPPVTATPPPDGNASAATEPASPFSDKDRALWKESRFVLRYVGKTPEEFCANLGPRAEGDRDIWNDTEPTPLADIAVAAPAEAVRIEVAGLVVPIPPQDYSLDRYGVRGPLGKLTIAEPTETGGWWQKLAPGEPYVEILSRAFAVDEHALRCGERPFAEVLRDRLLHEIAKISTPLPVCFGCDVDPGADQYVVAFDPERRWVVFDRLSADRWSRTLHVNVGTDRHARIVFSSEPGVAGPAGYLIPESAASSAKPGDRPSHIAQHVVDYGYHSTPCAARAIVEAHNAAGGVFDYKGLSMFHDRGRLSALETAAFACNP